MCWHRSLALVPGWFIGLGLFLGLAAEAMGCPVCTERRMLQSYWHFKVFAVLLAAPVLVTFTRLNPIRVLYTFVPLVLLNMKLIMLAIWYEHPAAGATAVTEILIIGLLVTTSLLAPVLICCLGRFAFYRRGGKKGFLIWQPFAYCAVLWLAGPYLRF